VKDLVVETPEGVTLRYELAGAGTRTAAGLIDLCVFLAVWLSLLFVVLFVSMGDTTGVSQFAIGVLAGGVVLLPAVYQIAFACLWDGQTLGKRLLGIRALDAHGGAASRLQHVLRGLFWPFEALVFAFPVPISLILISATQRAQRLGDLVAGTVVLYDPRPSAHPEPFARERWSALPGRRLGLVPAHADRLDAGDQQLLRELLARVDLDPAARHRLFRDAALWYVEKLGLSESAALAEMAPRDVVRELYLFVRERRGPEPAPPLRATPAPLPAGGATAPGSAPGAAAPPR
jgi:uncharacterized RDD family membrane protein YckC